MNGTRGPKQNRYVKSFDHLEMVRKYEISITCTLGSFPLYPHHANYIIMGWLDFCGVLGL